jgi:predicted peroxiredoxin
MNKLLIILTTGLEDRGNRATLAFCMGVSAAISNIDTTIFMTMGGTVWARATAHEKVRIDGFEPLKVYVDRFCESGGKILVCSPCDAFYCSIAPASNLIAGAELAGLTHVVDLVMNASVVTL